MKNFLVLPAAVTCLAALLPLRVGSQYGKQVDAGGHRLRMKVMGKGSPAVVLESHGIAPAEAWARVQPGVAAFTQVVSYDHAGFWGSEPGPRPRDARQVATELHTALHNAGVAPPYVLVGHSFGGPYIRVFAGLYPQDVAGLVLIDPSQEEAFELYRARRPEMNLVPPAEKEAQTEFGCTWDSLEQARAAKLPDVPVTLMTCLWSDGSQRAAETLSIWLDSHRRWLRGVPHAKHIIAERSKHGIVVEEPELVIDVIAEVVTEARRRNP